MAMSTKFFNNEHGNTLFEKIKGIAEGMKNLHSFLAVVGYFRSSGYFKLRKELGDISEIKILVGINIDDIFRNHNQALLMLADEDKAKEIYQNDFKEDIINAKYSPDVEEGILQMCDDLVSGRLKMRIHATKNLHAKFYLCLPKEHGVHSDGWVIMGSSNISESGLGINQAPHYELNVALKDFDDVKYCSDEFWRLWGEAIELRAEDIDSCMQNTYLGYQPTPYELYIKVLIDTFGSQVEDDFSIELPNEIKDLKYQKDAVIQGYQMLLQHNGVFLADVVGLGKTMIATMIAKRFIEANGSNTNILVIYPPALEENWKKTFRLFSIDSKAQFITNGSLSKILDSRDNYKRKEQFDLIIVDEAHGFRSDSSNKYDELQKICKSSCENIGLLKSRQKKVMLLSATPLNNRPADLLNQLLLFQNSQSCTIEGIPSLKGFFAPFIDEYKKLMAERETRDVTEDVDKIYAEIRNKLIDKVTVRRTRSNILNDADYNADIATQGIVFPKILPPNELEYEMDSDTSDRFYKTLARLTNGESDNPEEYGLSYARYRAVEFLKPEYRGKYKNAEHVGKSLAGIYRVHMVKRLESSFFAFKKSLQTLLRITEDMIKMFEQDKVIIAPDLKVKELQAKGMELDEIIEHAINKGYVREDIEFKAADFELEFLEMLRRDDEILKALNEEWAKEFDDPKFDKFKEELVSDFFDPSKNKSGKLVLFSESVDTLSYLYDRLTQELGRTDILMVTANNRDRLGQVIKENFDANHPQDAGKYNIIITSDVLAEGVNLHRSNIIINYDSPWNATRLMQRIGRVNRIGSVASEIYNYMFYPSRQGDKEIKLYRNALVKLQGFHSAFGEDAQIFSKEEIVKEFQLFDNSVNDNIDKKIALLREVRELYNNDRKLYHKIKTLPMKSRVMRDMGKHSRESVVFVSSSLKTEFYLAKPQEGVKPIDFLEAVEYLRATPEEQAVLFSRETQHYVHVKKALEQYTTSYLETADDAVIQRVDLDKISQIAIKFLRTVQQIAGDVKLKSHCDLLIKSVEKGVYAQLPRYLKSLAKEYNNDRKRMREEEYRLQVKISELVDEYHIKRETRTHGNSDITNPQIIISETFR